MDCCIAARLVLPNTVMVPYCSPDEGHRGARARPNQAGVRSMVERSSWESCWPFPTQLSTWHQERCRQRELREIWRLRALGQDLHAQCQRQPARLVRDILDIAQMAVRSTCGGDRVSGCLSHARAG